MKIKWFGHSCFKITNDNNISIVTDPFDGSVGYSIPRTHAEIVTVSHDHFDHNYIDAIDGDFKLVNKVGVFNVRDINIRGTASYHDNEGGRKRGNNIIYTFNIDGIKVCHLGDLGHMLDDKQLSQIGGVDVLLIPVGGYYTIDAEEAASVVGQLNPGIIIPMHYKTPAVDMPIQTENAFVEKMGGAEKISSQVIEIRKADLTDKRKTYVLQYE